MVEEFFSAWSRIAILKSVKSWLIQSISSRSHSLKSVATWSFLDLPVWSFLPGSPTISNPTSWNLSVSSKVLFDVSFS